MRTVARRLVALVGVLFLAVLVGPPAGDALAPLASAALTDGDGEAADSDCDCPEDDEDGECPSGCGACSCCPAASPASSPPAQLPVFAGIGDPAHGAHRANAPPDGARRRVFHPPRPC